MLLETMIYFLLRSITINYFKPDNCVQYFMQIFMTIFCIKNNYLKRAAAAAIVSNLHVFVYVEPRKPSSETRIDLCGTHISALSYLFIDP